MYRIPRRAPVTSPAVIMPSITSQGAFNGAYSNPFGRTYTAQLTLNF